MRITKYRKDSGSKREPQHEQHKVALVMQSNTRINPRAMVVHEEDTAITHAAVVCALGLGAITLPAPADRLWHPWGDRALPAAVEPPPLWRQDTPWVRGYPPQFLCGRRAGETAVDVRYKVVLHVHVGGDKDVKREEEEGYRP